MPGKNEIKEIMVKHCKHTVETQSMYQLDATIPLLFI
jgi:hypothetical protein